ncbi:MAG: multicopper oxidase domain-containing protein, partial [Rhodospirillales bacterium]|nr:multicopper oxidase domain-containing protein [Rhodospirillales bacterium]
MTAMLSRRALLASASLAVLHPARAQPVAKRLVAGTRVLEVNGRPATVFALSQPDGTHGVRLDLGEAFRVELDNQAGEPTIVHWHGQTPPPAQDGVTDTGFAAPIPAGGSAQYDFRARAGTHWMHSHHGLQEQRLMAAPLVVRTPEDLRADLQDVTVLLHDFTFRDPAEVLAGLTGSNTAGGHAMAGMGGAVPGMSGAMAHGGVMTHEGGHAGADAGTASHGGGMAHGGAAGAPHAATAMTGMPMDLNDVAFDAFLANDRPLADPLVVRTEAGAALRLRLINGATATSFWIDLNGLEGQVVAVDGNDVVPLVVRRLPLAQGQRVDLLLRLPRGTGAVPILAQREGDRARTGLILAPPGAAIRKLADQADQAVPPIDLSLERRLRAAAPLPPRHPDRVHEVMLSGTMQPYAWAIDGRAWADHRPLRVAAGERVELNLVNRSMMAHPMHLHGHHFQVLALNGTALPGAVRDTVLVPVGGRVRVAFQAENPG